MGHLRVTIGHLRVTVGHPRVTIGHLRATMGHLVDFQLLISIVDYGYRLSIIDIDVDYQYRLFSFLSFSKLKKNLTELHPKVRPTCFLNI